MICAHGTLADLRAANTQEFERAQNLIFTSPELIQSIDKSIAGTKLYHNRVKHLVGDRCGEVRVFDADSFDVARKLVADGYRTAVLNMSSATNPGGGVENGASAQEESLCRQSTLYYCLTTDDLRCNYYRYHRERNDASYTDTAFYIPEVTVLLGERFCVDVISVAAPNLRHCSLDTQTVAEIIKARIANVMDICAAQGDTAIVLGALGCGAFKNDVKLVAAELRQLIFDESYAKLFDRVDFAVLGRGEVGRENYRVFSALLQS
jgi:uncharacterized protein (TIGR02452 family)